MTEPTLLAGFLTTRDTALELNVAESTLKRWRSEGSGPTPCRIGGRVYYRRTVLAAWIEAEAERKFSVVPDDTE